MSANRKIPMSENRKKTLYLCSTSGNREKKSLKAVKPYLSKAPAPWWDLKGGTPITTRQVQLTDPFFTGGVIVFLVKKLMHVEESYSPKTKGNIGFSSSLRPYY